ncbi:MAG: hypothetical protein DRQ63_09600 [Gammaproteobacteria bacterium]|nr:MAG: hypothetical protein DRQ63_09600 [Gammaproteobacteria bacterium]
MPLNPGQKRVGNCSFKLLFLLLFSAPVTQSAGKPVALGAESPLSWKITVWQGESAMTGDTPNKVLVRRPSKIKTDRRGRSVWADPVESAKLELVSTQTLKQILSSSDQQNRKAIEEAANTATDGVLARDPATGYFEIIDDTDLQAILDTNSDLPKLTRPADVTLEPLHDYADDESMSLVTTMALRKVLAKGDDDSLAETEVDSSGMDPYNSN